MPKTIHIIEPTLSNEAGHCFSFISALCRANTESFTLCLWTGRQARLLFAEKNIRIRPYFYRKIRRLQAYFLYRQLLATPDRIFISTAGRTDLLLLNWAARGVVPPKKTYLYFHWFKSDAKKIEQLKALALRQPNLEILGPTPSVVKAFADAGFKHTRVVPYPVLKREVPAPTEAGTFRHLLYAGAARRDKGFSQVVDLVACLQDQGLQIAVTLQTSSEHYGKYDPGTQADIQRLQGIHYPFLKISPETLGLQEYVALFEGAICLQLYDPADFSDRVSGVTLDAFAAGCPVVARSGTWIANMVLRFDAGVVVDDTSAPTVLSAVDNILHDYARYQMNSSMAGNLLQQENSADTLFGILAEDRPDAEAPLTSPSSKHPGTMS